MVRTTEPIDARVARLNATARGHLGLGLDRISLIPNMIAMKIEITLELIQKTIFLIPLIDALELGLLHKNVQIGLWYSDRLFSLCKLGSNNQEHSRL